MLIPAVSYWTLYSFNTIKQNTPVSELRGILLILASLPISLMFIHLFALSNTVHEFTFTNLLVLLSERLLALVALLTFNNLLIYLTHFERLLLGTDNDLFNDSFFSTSEL